MVKNQMMCDFMETNNEKGTKENLGYEIMMSEDVKALMKLFPSDLSTDIAYDMSLSKDNTLLLLTFKIIDSKLKIVEVKEITPEFISTFIKDKAK